VGDIRVLLVEDHPVVIEGLQLSLERHGFDVVGAAVSAAEGRRLAQEKLPEVVLVDFNLPDASGGELAAWIREASPQTSVIFLTGDESDDALLAALDAGARGFLFKTQPPAQIADAIRQAASGRSVMPPGRVSEVLARRRERQQAAERTRQERERLTARELEILTMLAQGMATKEIAAKLFLSVATVRWYVQQTIEKLEAHSKIEALARARELGLIE
jgi:two-component system, NarL family, response regulator DevR